MTRITSSFSCSVCDTLLNAVPTYGRSPSTGTRLEVAWTLFWIRPPIAKVWPLSSITAQRACCSLKDGMPGKLPTVENPDTCRFTGLIWDFGQ